VSETESDIVTEVTSPHAHDAMCTSGTSPGLDVPRPPVRGTAGVRLRPRGRGAPPARPPARALSGGPGTAMRRGSRRT